LRVAYHAACSLQHGQQVHAPPRELLQQAGFEVVEIPEGHLCCGSAGTYNMLQPEMAAELGRRKLGHIATLGVDCIAAGNLGCMTQLAQGADQPIVHTVELLDWATGGPVPPALAQLRAG
jgi:glycolate oxidase iron-sulfur subunit